MKHQRRRFIPGVVGPMPEEHAGSLQAARDACDQVGDGDVE
jgi:hypothetical protein